MNASIRTNRTSTVTAIVSALAMIAGIATINAEQASASPSASAAKAKHKTSSRQRATVSWTSQSDVDIDLFVFDRNGNVGSAKTNGISRSMFSPDALGQSGTETFTDKAFRKKGKARAFSYGVCFHDVGSVHATYTIKYTNKKGKTFTDTHEFGSSGVSKDYPAGAPIPMGYCQD